MKEHLLFTEHVEKEHMQKGMQHIIRPLKDLLKKHMQGKVKKQKHSAQRKWEQRICVKIFFTSLLILIK